MTTATLVERLDVHWKVPGAAPGESARFERVTRELGGAPLARAVDQADFGLAADELVCVRQVDVPALRVRSDLGDSDVLRELSDAIATALQAAVSGSPSPSLLRYRSPAHAALDLVISLSRGDRHDEWAWEQLGLLGPGPSGSVDGSAVVDAFSHAPHFIVSLVAQAAKEGALAALVDTIGAPGFDELIRLAWQDRGTVLAPWPEILPGWTASRTLDGTTPVGESDVPADSVIAAVVELLERTSIGRALARGGLGQPLAIVAASAAALLEADPTLPRLPTARLVDLVRSGAVVALEASTASTGHHVAPPATRDAAQDTKPTAAGTPETQHDQPEVPAPVQERNGVPTDFGGLPFLLHLVDADGLPDRFVAGGDNAGLLSPVLYGIGTRILGELLGDLDQVDPDDPALACFCGRQPVDHWHDDVVAGTDAALVARHAARETERLVAVLRQVLSRDEGSTRDVLSAVCRRHARVVADPGWIDVHLELVEVSTAVRRAGLDLDLGFRPWLGCVVRFVYD